MENSFSSKRSVSLLELATYSAITVGSWILSGTVLFPLFVALKLSSWLRSKFFSWLLRTVPSDLFLVVTQMRLKLFEFVGDHFDTTGDSAQTVRVLEIGVGSGPNFPYYPEKFSVSLLDANPNFLSFVKGVTKLYPNLNVDRIILCTAENMTDVQDEEFDLVLCTHLLCSVSDVEAVLKEIHRVLKKGGKFAFMEHTAYPENHVAYRIQKCMTPLWKVYFDGCELKRNPIKLIKAYFQSLTYEVIYPSTLFLYFRPHVIGIASK